MNHHQHRGNVILSLILGTFTFFVQAQPITWINNNTFWHTTDGTPIYCQGGGIFRYPDPQTGVEHYYWYGMHYSGAESYSREPLAMNNNTRFVSVTCYQSDDLLHWTHVADVLTPDAFEGHGRPFWVGRMGVAYMSELQCYALLIQYNSSVLVCISKSPLGPFEWHNQIDMTSRIGTTNTGDQTVFVDDNGKAYLVYSNGRGRNRIFLSEIGVKEGVVTLLDCHEIFSGGGREGNCMFRYKDTYYVCASDLYGWNASHVYYMKSKHIYGPYEPAEGMAFMPGSELDYGHVTQTGFFYRVKGTEEETVIYCGDRWSDFAGNGNGFNQWVPLTFDADEVPHFHSLSQWTIDARTGRWQVGPDNNYVLNGSFEADRRIIPIQVKPVQAFMHAWDTEVLAGNIVRVADSISPKLNYFNTPDDRRTVVGNYSLNISDEVDFERRVSQQIFSTERVPLADGTYTLRALVKVKGRFDKLQMYAEGPAGNYLTDIVPTDTLWHEVIIPNVKVSSKHLRIGFHAKGKAHSQCRVDDVSLRASRIRTVTLSSIMLSDPCILADSATQMYYMTGTGGMLWKSRDLKMWEGPFRVEETDPQSWMGPRPMIWAAELHQYKGKYYYFATFTNQAEFIDSVRGNKIERRASHVLVSDRPDGPYRPFGDDTYLPANRPTLDGTFWIDRDGKPYMVYCWEWLQNWDGTIEKIELKPDLSGTIGEGEILFRASDSPWSREMRDGKVVPNKVTDGPWLFRTATGRLGMLWTSWVFGDYTQGVAYSESGTLDGPWIQEPEPVTPPNYGHGMLFRTLDGRWMMSVHSHSKVNGHTIRIPCIFPVDLSGEKLKVITGQ